MLKVDYKGLELEEVLAEETPGNSDNLPASIIPTDLDLNSEIVNNIIEAPNKEALQKQFDAFNISQSKKNALRIIKLDNLLDKIEDQVGKRIANRPDQISNKELLDYLQAVSSQIDRSRDRMETLIDKPAITINNQKNEVNINVAPKLTRDDKEQVIDIIQDLIKQMNEAKAVDDISNNDILTEDNNIEGTVVQVSDVLNSEDSDEEQNE